MGLAFLITTDNLQLLSERKVLKENEYAALLDASAVVDTARKEAARIGQQAESGAEASRRKGYEEGLAQARAEYARQLVTDSMAVERQLHALRTSMAQIVVKAVGQFLAEADPAVLFRSALLRVEALLRAESFITVRVAPAQEAHMRETLHRLRTDANWNMAVTITPDADLPSGACLVQTSTGVLEIGVDAQLEAFRRAVEQGGMLVPSGTSGRAQ
ncbi:type III secretion system stator protein SctL [Variovorax sp. 770b2]|jgi:type III secretion protein L|uniref:type III secretion system stator protein SctL n=1 Tax=Variovorax sp. 770b2 TaxID=1566271 RepID=UPI0008DF3C51|nr:type III secretion system stator protein SctL [Variovorax sp. 770b2]SFP40339.1 type III secretion protein L [Variovorax sp. 770b2]